MVTAMEAMDVILGRRSIRKYTAEPVADEQVKRLLEAGMAAPSAHNRQPWHFIVIDDKATLLEIPKFHKYSKMLEQAPLAIVVCGDLELEAGTGFWVQDCAAATQNILLAAKAMRLGAVWLGAYPNEGIVKSLRSLLKVPERNVPFCIISVGHPMEEKPPANRYDVGRVHRNLW
jgi:nitroreductase